MVQSNFIKDCLQNPGSKDYKYIVMIIAVIFIYVFFHKTRKTGITRISRSTLYGAFGGIAVHFLLVHLFTELFLGLRIYLDSTTRTWICIIMFLVIRLEYWLRLLRNSCSQMTWPYIDIKNAIPIRRYSNVTIYLSSRRSRQLLKEERLFTYWMQVLSLLRTCIRITFFPRSHLAVFLG